MSGKVRFFGQHTLETCGISCLLMAMDYFGVDYPIVGNEHAYYARYGTKTKDGLGGTLGAGIALALARKKLDVKLVHASPNLLENYGDYFEAEKHRKYLDKHKEQIRLGEGLFTVEAGVNITCDTLRAELRKSHLVIVQILLGEKTDALRDRVMHWILLYGETEDGGFLVCDPQEGKKKMPQDELADGMQTPFGASFISVGAKK